MTHSDIERFDYDQRLLSKVNDEMMAAENGEKMITQRQWRVVKKILLEDDKLKVPDKCLQECLRCHKPRGQHYVVRSRDRDYANDDWLMCPEGRFL